MSTLHPSTSSLTINPASTREQESLYYFRTLAAHDFQGYAQSDFWSSMVYQRSLSHPGIYHALLAVSNAHREWNMSSVKISCATLAQYGKAIRIAVARLQEDKTEQFYLVGLYCCILLYYFELLNSDISAAEMHLENALRLLREWHSSATEWPPATLDATSRSEFFQLLYTVGRMDVDRLVGDAEVKHLERNSRAIHNGLLPVTRGPVNAFTLGCHLLIFSRHTVCFARRQKAFRDTPAPEILPEVRFRQRWLQTQSDGVLALLDRFQADLDLTTMAGRQTMMSVHTMRLYLIAARGRLNALIVAEPDLARHQYNDYAEQMLNLADLTLDLDCAPPLRQGFMPEPGVIAPIRRMLGNITHDGLRDRARVTLDRLMNVESRTRDWVSSGRTAC